MKKKKGSSILMILAISAVIVMLLGTAVGAMVFTQKGNFIEKQEDDLIYAAEAGIEQAVMNVDNLMYSTLAIGDIRNFDLNTKFISQNMTVNVSVEKMPDDQSFRAISKAKFIGTTREKIVTAIIKKKKQFTPGSKNLLQYSLCGENVNLFTSGALNPDFTLINSTNTPNFNSMGASSPVAGESEAFMTPDFNFAPYSVGGIKKDIVISNIAELDAMKGVQNSGVVKETYEIKTAPHRTSKTSIYLVNAPNLIINPNGPISLNNMIIVSSGNITVIQADKMGGIDVNGRPKPGMVMGTGQGNTIYLNNSSIIGKSVNLYIANFTVTNPTYKDNGSNFIHDMVDVNGVNAKITAHANNWNINSGTPGGETWTATEMQYD